MDNVAWGFTNGFPGCPGFIYGELDRRPMVVFIMNI
jgi:hypothetical protein